MSATIGTPPRTTNGTSKKPSRRDQSPRAASPEAGPRQYQHLEAVDRQVPRHIIDSTWEPLPVAAVDRVMQILNNVERSVVMRLQDERKRTQASTAVQMVIRRLNRKIARGLPFPPGTKTQREEDFDFEKILDGTRSQEAQLTPALHSTELLKSEIRKEAALLEQETAALEQLERNAKSERQRRRAEAKKLHASLQQSGMGDESRDTLNFADVKTPLDILDVSTWIVVQCDLTNVYQGEKIDDDLKPIVEELQSHVDSMRNNFKQVEGIMPAMDQSEASIRVALRERIDPQRYVQVIMG